MKKLAKITNPQYYFGDFLVYDSKSFDTDSMKYWNQHSFKVLFNNLHAKLQNHLNGMK